MKKAIAVMMLLAGGLVAAPRVSVGIGFSAPAPVAVAPPCPGPGYAWVNGYYAPSGVWVAGYWSRPDMTMTGTSMNEASIIALNTSGVKQLPRGAGGS